MPNQFSVKTRCGICGEPFTEAHPRMKGGYARHRDCHYAHKRKMERARYVAANAYRVGTPRGNKVGWYDAREERSQTGIAEAIDEFRIAEQAKIDALPHELPRTCKFCVHMADEPCAHTLQQCDLDREPDVDGGCDGWEPRYRTEDPL